MNEKKLLQKILATLLVGALMLTIALAMTLVVGKSLEQMGDSTGASVLGGVGLGIGILWLIDLVGLVVTLGIRAVIEPDRTDSSKRAEVTNRTDYREEDGSGK